MSGLRAREMATGESCLPVSIIDKTRRVLLIDDDDFVCAAVAQQLRMQGISDVTISHGGAEVVRLLNEGGPYNLIISDLAMPEIDGVQLMRLIAARQKAAALMYISASGQKLLSATTDLARERGLKILPAIVKPITLDRLRASLMELDACGGTKVAGQIHPQIKASDLRKAIDSGEIRAFVQPQLNAHTGELHGVEALARWQSDKFGHVPPDHFIALAEANGLIDALTESMLRQSLSACAQWMQFGLETHISVNAPISSLCNLTLPDIIITQVGRYGLHPEQLTLEITETGIQADPVRVLDVLTRLRLRGVGLAIDDFGCGHSTFKQLRLMPFNELKIDCSFVFNMFKDADSSSIVKSSLQIARDLNLLTVAEGVETREHWDALARLGCDVVQGYFVARPFPAEHLVAWVRDSGSNFRKRNDLKQQESGCDDIRW